MLNLFKKYKGLIMYGIFGVLTTAINIITYNICYGALQISNVAANVIAWILSVLFAYITNKLFVFESKSFKASVLFREMVSFFGCRVATGVLDLVIMYVAVDVLLLHAMLWKVISNVLVIIINFVLSKLIVFKESK